MKYLFLVLSSVVILSCGSSETTENGADKAADTATLTTVAETPDTTGIDYSMCANKVDPVCKMKLADCNGGKIKDTCMMADGKIIGFCSAGCKEQCMASPNKEKLMKDCCEKK